MVPLEGRHLSQRDWLFCLAAPPRRPRRTPAPLQQGPLHRERRVVSGHALVSSCRSSYGQFQMSVGFMPCVSVLKKRGNSEGTSANTVLNSWRVCPSGCGPRGRASGGEEAAPACPPATRRRHRWQRATNELVTVSLFGLLGTQALGAELEPVAHPLEHRGNADEAAILAPQGRQAAQLWLHQESGRLGTRCQVGEPFGQQAQSGPDQRGGRALPRSRLSLASRPPPPMRHRAPCDTVSQRQTCGGKKMGKQKGRFRVLCG